MSAAPPRAAPEFERRPPFGLWSAMTIRRSTQGWFLEPCRFRRRRAPRQCAGLARRGGHPVLGLAQARHRLRLGRGRRAGAAAVFAVRAHRRAADGRGLADRRRARSRRASAADRLDAGRLRRRLVDGLRLFSRRALVGRRGVPGRGRQVRLGAAARRRRPAGGARGLSGRGLCDRARSYGRPARRASSRSRSGSGSPSGRAASSSPAFPGTTSAWRWAAISRWLRSPRSSACTG